jgi:hypothetical protein
VSKKSREPATILKPPRLPGDPSPDEPPRQKRLVVKGGGGARRVVPSEEAERPLTFWGLMIRFLPVWALLIMMLILVPSLPLRAAGTVVDWLKGLGATSEPPVAEPVFIVEGAQGGPAEADLPPPTWSLDVSQAFTPEVLHWADTIGRWSLTYRIKPNLIATLMQIESCGDPAAVSAAGAQGLFQVLPLHFDEGEDPLDPETNAKRGLTFFAEMYGEANGDLGLTFAAYNGGPSIIDLSPSDWPSETQSYQYWGSGIFEETETGLKESPTLQDWLDAGGSSLCDQAAQALGISP